MTDRIVLITGATGVLGTLAAQAFARQGDSLALLSNDQGLLESIAGDLKLPDKRIFIQTIDLLDAPAVRESARIIGEKFGRVDVLVHLVGGWTGGKTLPDASPDDLSFMLNQHVWTTFNLFQAFSPLLASSSQGRVIAVSSPLTVKPVAKMGVYSAAKAAQENLVLTLGEELHSKGVTANIIHVKSIDVKHTGEGTLPEEILSILLFLSSSGAGRISGTRIPAYK
jgi:NAD(P)-dependent dehydrogenase (short-subunit alcohol dehydrogenase family)